MLFLIQYWSAQFLGVTLATLTFTLTSSGPGNLSIVVPLTSCKSLHWGPSLFLITLFSSAWVYIALSAFDGMALTLESCCTFYGLATGAAYAAATASIQSRGIASGLLNTWIGVLGLLNAGLGGSRSAGAAGTTNPRFVSSATSSFDCDALFIVAPIVGCCLGALLSWLTSLNGSEYVGFFKINISLL